MAAAMEKTKTPGVYRRGSRYVVTWRDAAGKAKKESRRTYDEARDLKRKHDQQARDGEAHVPAREQVTLEAYSVDLYGANVGRSPHLEPARGRYQGRKGAVRDSTRDEYARQMRDYWLPELGSRRLPSITAPDIARVLAKLATRDDDGVPRAEVGNSVAHYLADGTLKRIFAALSALLACAVEEGVIRHNPARDVKVPSGRDELRRFDEDDEDSDDPEPGKAKALTSTEVQAFLLVVDTRWRLFFMLLAATGLRISEALALRWRDFQLDGDKPAVKVRRGVVKGKYGPPKSKHGRRDVPIPFEIVRALRERHKASEWHGPNDLVWPSLTGNVMDQGNLRNRVLSPAAGEAGVAWSGFHAFRHHCASRLIEKGRNIVQVSRWLGHHSPSFTLSTYAHLMDDGVGEALDLVDRATSGNEVATSAPFGTAIQPHAETADTQQ